MKREISERGHITVKDNFQFNAKFQFEIFEISVKTLSSSYPTLFEKNCATSFKRGPIEHVLTLLGDFSPWFKNKNTEVQVRSYCREKSDKKYMKIFASFFYKKKIKKNPSPSSFWWNRELRTSRFLFWLILVQYEVRTGLQSEMCKTDCAPPMSNIQQSRKLDWDVVLVCSSSL